MKTTMIMLAAALMGSAAMAQASGKDAFIRQQAMAELQRVTSQIDLLQNNYEDLARRVGKLEKGGGETEALRAEIASLRTQLSELKKQLASQREEIVKDISGKIAKMQVAQPEPKAKSAPAVQGPYLEYTVQSGDTLSLIAQAFNTSVAKIKAMNPKVNANALRIGQKIKVPKE